MYTKKRVVKALLILLLFMAAVALSLYPFIANSVFDNRTLSTINAVEQEIEDRDDTDLQAQIEAAQEYNKIIANGYVTLTDPFITPIESENGNDETYESLLCANDEGVMGTIDIPSIDVYLPIYHGTSDDTLTKGVGHLQGTSLPVGGESTHAVLTGHTGLSDKKLFTDLTQLEIGDIFFLEIMGEMIAYEVDQIEVVLPKDLDSLSVVQGKDYCTLVTCTPYGVNSHRLLVRGVRTDYEAAVNDPVTYVEKETSSNWMSEYKKALIISIVILIIGLVVLRVVIMIRSKKQLRKYNAYNQYKKRRNRKKK